MTPLAPTLKLTTPIFSITWGITVIPPKQERVKPQENGHRQSSAETEGIRIQEERKESLSPLSTAFATRPNEISTDNRRLILQLASKLNLALVSVLSYLIYRNPLVPLDFQEKKTKKIFYSVSLSVQNDKLTFQV